jgi:hypothetical protein
MREMTAPAPPADAEREAIESNSWTTCTAQDARTLALLAPSLRSSGVEATRASMVELMAEMGENFPRQPGEVSLRQRRALPPPHVARQIAIGPGCSGCFTEASVSTCFAP